MGAEIAKCLAGPLVKREGYLETGEGIVTWGFGHILRQAEPGEYEERYKMWREDDLPIVPQEWKLLVADSCVRQFGIVQRLINEADEIIHAGDPDREGQLLIDEVLGYVGNTKPVRRILLNALDEKSIRKANASLRDNKDFFNLQQSALARARADWLIGMNLSRAYTLAARRAGHEVTWPIGRVKTPTLALVVRREREIADFKPVAYYTLKACFAHEAGEFTAVWQPGDNEPGLDNEGRMLSLSRMEERLAFFAKEPKVGSVVSYSKTRKKEGQRLPFSLSSLQVLAGKKYGYEPQLVLDTAQKLYERKLTTYPRSDCEYLPQNQFAEAGQILGNLSALAQKSLSGWAQKADKTIKSRAWNDKKISAHHAIIPTTVRADFSRLSAVEQHIYFLVAQAYIAQFYPPFSYEQTKLEILYKEEIFSASGRVPVLEGWKELYAAAQHQDDLAEEEDTASLPRMQKKDPVAYVSGQENRKETRAPQHFTAASLLAGMKEIHKYVKDEQARKKLKAVYGIGTEATRAAIIDDLLKRQLLQQKGKKKYLFPSEAAEILVDALPDELTYPDTTAVWEDRLHSMAEGEGTLADFLASQVELTRILCQKAREVHIERTGAYPCPRCHKGVLKRRQGRKGFFWGCSNYPRCRMSCDDVSGQPDLTSAAAKEKTKAVFSAGGTAYLSEQEMADFNENFAPLLSAQELIARGSAGRQQKNSAQPQEDETAAQKLGSKWLCPRCKEGSLHQIKGRNGSFWGCTNYPQCTATFDDAGGKPVL